MRVSFLCYSKGDEGPTQQEALVTGATLLFEASCPQLIPCRSSSEEIRSPRGLVETLTRSLFWAGLASSRSDGPGTSPTSRLRDLLPTSHLSAAHRTLTVCRPQSPLARKSLTRQHRSACLDTGCGSMTQFTKCLPWTRSSQRERELGCGQHSFLTTSLQRWEIGSHALEQPSLFWGETRGNHEQI